MAITSLNTVVGQLPGQALYFHKVFPATVAQPNFYSFWKQGNIPPAGSIPGTGGEIPTNITSGALTLRNAGGSNSLYLAGTKTSTSSVSDINLLLYDRLFHISGLSGIQTADTGITSIALTRPDANGANTEIWMEIYTALGNTTSTLTVKYTNQSGTTGQTTSLTISSGVGAFVAGVAYNVPLVTGDTGVRAITSYSWSPSTGTAGDFGFTILRRIAEIPVTACANYALQDSFLTGFPSIYNNACLALYGGITISTGSSNTAGCLNLVEG